MALSLDVRPKIGAVLLQSIPAGVALFLGVFSILNVVGSLFWPGLDASIWWVDMRSLPATLGKILLLACAVCLCAFAVRRPVSRWGKVCTVFCAGFLAVLSLTNAITFYVLASKSRISPGIPIPFSLIVSLGLTWIVAQVLWPPAMNLRIRNRLVLATAVAGCCAVLFPLAQMFCFGKTDYRRVADVAIVPGARAYADGRPSDALADRVRTACQLYRDGTVRKLIFSGGPGDGAVHETEAMRNMAVNLGVKPADIILDKQGLNTRATVRNTIALLDRIGAKRIIVVSHFYHLPRLKLTYSRANLEVYTVPAREQYLLSQLPYNMAREIVALWAYYLYPGKM